MTPTARFEVLTALADRLIQDEHAKDEPLSAGTLALVRHPDPGRLRLALDLYEAAALEEVDQDEVDLVALERLSEDVRARLDVERIPTGGLLEFVADAMLLGAEEGRRLMGLDLEEEDRLELRRLAADAVEGRSDPRTATYDELHRVIGEAAPWTVPSGPNAGAPLTLKGRICTLLVERRELLARREAAEALLVQVSAWLTFPAEEFAAPLKDTVEAFLERGAVPPVAPLPPEVLQGLDPGVRDLVVRLREAGHETTDSGDGLNEGEGALPFPHVAVRARSDRPLMEARRMAKSIPAGWTVEVSVAPGEATLLVARPVVASR